MEGPRKITKDISQDSRCLARDSNQVPSENKSISITLRHPAQWSGELMDFISNWWMNGLMHTGKRNMII
jgi:hypothetical protein